MARWSSRPSHRLRLRTGVAAFACTVLVTASILGPSMEPSRAAMDRPDGDVEVLRDVPYYTGPGASDTKHVLDLYLPASGIGYPTALFLHGGGWRSGDKQEVPGELYDNIGYGLASRGIAVAIANYRLTDGSAQSVSHPGHIQDVARAFSFTRAYMVTGGGDPNSIYVLGHEAGAHLAALLATNERFLALHGLAAADVRVVVGLSGMYHVDALGGDDEDVFGAEPGSRRDASPIDNVETARAPFELMVAEADRAGLDQEAERFARALLAVGVPAEVHEIAGRDHSSIVSAVGESGDMTTGLIVDFIYGGRYRTATPTVTSSPTLTPRPTAGSVFLPAITTY